MGFTRPLGLAQSSMAVYGSPRFLGTIVSTTTKNNSDTAVPFTIPAGSVLLLQPTAEVQILPGTTAAATATTGNGLTILADERFTFILAEDEAYVACVGAASTLVWQLR